MNDCIFHKLKYTQINVKNKTNSLNLLGWGRGGGGKRIVVRGGTGGGMRVSTE